MKKDYFLFLITSFALLIGAFGYGQNLNTQESAEQQIEHLTIYPNPVSHSQNQIYITTKLNATKHIEFYDVLGKRIFTQILTGRTLNISNLKKGVYILRITEKTRSETRKLVIK